MKRAANSSAFGCGTISLNTLCRYVISMPFTVPIVFYRYFDRSPLLGLPWGSQSQISHSGNGKECRRGPYVCRPSCRNSTASFCTRYCTVMIVVKSIPKNRFKLPNSMIYVGTVVFIDIGDKTFLLVKSCKHLQPRVTNTRIIKSFNRAIFCNKSAVY